MNTAIVVDRPVVDRDSVGRWVWFFTACLFVVTALAGFAPRSIEILMGERRNPPLVVHVQNPVERSVVDGHRHAPDGLLVGRPLPTAKISDRVLENSVE